MCRATRDAGKINERRVYRVRLIDPKEQKARSKLQVCKTRHWCSKESPGQILEILNIYGELSATDE